MKNSRFDFPLRLSIFYAVIASLWIILSDHWLAGYLNNGSNSGQTYKGLFYIAVTALFLYTLTRREREKQEQTQNTLRENEAKYRQLFEMASDTVLLIDIKSQSILEANRAACQLYGYSRDDLIQKNIRDISQATPESITDSIQSRLEFVPQHIHRKKDGTTFPVEITGRYFTRQGREVLIVVIRDISERLKIDETIRQHSREVSLLYEAGQRLGRTLDIETIYEALFDVVKRRFQCDGLFVSSYSTTDQLIRCVYARHEGERLNTAEFPPIPLQPTGTGTQSIVIRTGEPMLLGDYQAYMHTSQVHFNIGTSGIRPDDEIPEDGNVTRSALIVPLKLEDRVIGVIQVFSYQLNAYTPKDLEFMSALGPQVSVAAANALLYQEAQNQIAERQRAEEAERAQRIFAETLRDTVAAVGNMPHFDQVLDQILGNIERVIPHGTANISLIENGFARIIRCQGYADQALEDAMQAVKWPVEVLPYLREVVQTRQAFLVADIHNFYSGNEEIQFPWIRSWVAAPVRIEGEVIGLINLDSDQVGYFTLRQAEQLQAFADQTAVVVQNMRLFNAERDQRTLAEALTRTAAALTSTLDLETVMQRILSEVGQVVPHDAANIMLVEGDKARVVSTSSNEAVQDQPSLKDAVLPLSFPLLRQMFSFGLPVQVSDTLTDSNWVRRTESSWVRSYVGAPIKAHQQVIGFITLHSRIPNFFTLEHANRLKAFADQAAVALENAQLYAELRGHAAELRQRVEQRTAELSR
ncbi:MAG: GAF domain-containing protein, partial [Chloroflexi bacterium]|nr:GAF domain-containing protein [Chloroflexota bacterium]